MRYFIDTEFIEDGSTIDLISIGIVAEDHRELYAERITCKFGRAEDWVRENVFPHLECKPQIDNRGIIVPTVFNGTGGNTQFVRALVSGFIGDDEEPEFWGYFPSYDWVAFCQLWGKMIDLPRRFPKRINDICQLDGMGDHVIFPEQQTTKHNAIEDARWVRDVFNWYVNRGARPLNVKMSLPERGPWPLSEAQYRGEEDV